MTSHVAKTRSMNHRTVLKTIRRLEAAEGYLELQLPARALEELGAIEEPGPFEASISLLKGEALKGQERYDDAIAALHKAAQMIPAPHNRRAWKSLGECYRLDGREELATLVDTFASAPQAPPRIIAPIINISITVQQPTDAPVENNKDELSDKNYDFDSDFAPGFESEDEPRGEEEFTDGNEFTDDGDFDDDEFDPEQN
jgi:tetratricopeptide (TPR) repeat protein